MRDSKIGRSVSWRTSGAARCRNPAPGRRGLTLMELVVVMTVLAALAAIVIPMFPNLLRRAHKVSDATQTSEMAKVVQLYQAAYIAYPNNFDLLTGGTTGFPSFLPSNTNSTVTTPTAFGGFAQAAALTPDEISALNSVGITTVQPLAPATPSPVGNFHPTMNPYPAASTVTGNSLTPTASTLFAVIDPAGSSYTNIIGNNPNFLQTVIAADPTARYVVFGVGPRCSMVGQTIQDAPTSVSQKANFTPDNTYSRVGVIFKVSGNEVANADNRAKFIASVALEDDELESTEKDLVGYYQVSRGTN